MTTTCLGHATVTRTRRGGVTTWAVAGRTVAVRPRTFEGQAGYDVELDGEVMEWSPRPTEAFALADGYLADLIEA